MRDGGRIHLQVSIPLLDVLVLVALGDVSDGEEVAKTILEVDLLTLYVDDFPLLLLTLEIHLDFVHSLFGGLVVHLNLIKHFEQRVQFVRLFCFIV